MGLATLATVNAIRSEGRFGITICYEAIFPNQVRHYIKEGADFLVNITNDAWFGKSAAPYQHLAMAALRAVENRIYLVRAANTGITAIVSPTGQILSQTDLFMEAALTGSIHLRKGETFYTRYGDVFAWLCLAFSLVALISLQKHHFKGRSVYWEEVKRKTKQIA